MTFSVTAVLVLGITGLVIGLVLYAVSRKFKVEEDPRVARIIDLLPGANCGGCGFAGCRNFAEACVKAGGIEGLACPVGGDPTMEEVQKILTPSAAAEETAPVASGDKKGFDPVIAEKIKALATPKAAFPNLIAMAQKL